MTVLTSLCCLPICWLCLLIVLNKVCIETRRVDGRGCRGCRLPSGFSACFCAGGAFCPRSSKLPPVRRRRHSSWTSDRCARETVSTEPGWGASPTRGCAHRVCTAPPAALTERAFPKYRTRWTDPRTSPGRAGPSRARLTWLWSRREGQQSADGFVRFFFGRAGGRVFLLLSLSKEQIGPRRPYVTSLPGSAVSYWSM